MNTPKNLETKLLESIQLTVKNSGTQSELDKAIATEMVDDYGKDLGIIGARIWKVGTKYTYLILQKGGRKKLKPGFKIESHYQPIKDILDNGVTVMDKDHPSFNLEIEEQIGSEKYIAIKLAPKKIMAIEVDDIAKAKPALQLVKKALESSIKKRELEDITQFASRVGKALLPKENNLPLKEYYDIAWYAKPARNVGGDLLFFKEIQGESAVISIGDARGKGVSASTVTLATHFGLGVATEFNPRASVLVEILNKRLYDCEITNEFISLFYSTLHKNGVLSYINAGHPYPLHFHKSKVNLLDKGGMLLGPLRESKYEPGTATMEINDILFIYTDGLSEVTNKRNKDLGVPGLEKIITKYKNESANIIKENILREVKDYMYKKSFQDDTTFAIIKKYK